MALLKVVKVQAFEAASSAFELRDLKMMNEDSRPSLSNA